MMDDESYSHDDVFLYVDEIRFQIFFISMYQESNKISTVEELYTTSLQTF